MSPGATKPTTIAKGITSGLRAAMERDPKVVLMGEDIGKLGGVFRVTEGLQKDFGEERVIDTPLAEAGILGTAIGMALRGYRPVIEIQFDGFVYPAFDHIVSQVAKLHARWRERHIASAPVKQANTQLAFELAYLQAEWGLRHVQYLGGPSEVQFLRDN